MVLNATVSVVVLLLLAVALKKHDIDMNILVLKVTWSLKRSTDAKHNSHIFF